MDKTEFLAFFCTAWLAWLLYGIKSAVEDLTKKIDLTKK